MIKLLDCTLRDGGYINDWMFGKNAIIDIKEHLELSGVDIIELGFLRDEDENPDRTIFNDIESVKTLIGDKLPNRQYAVMAEVSNPFPLDKLEPYSEGAPDIIRVIVWKRMLKEGFEYCKGIVEKGYKLCVQPARVSQYTDEEFVDMIKMFNELNPMAIYVVDSWGTMYKDELLHYLKLADENLKPGISVGYHGHNNLMQAFEVACAFCEQDLKRDLIIDASVYGIGRGAGNLNSELFAKWMNEKHHKDYKTECFTRIYDKYISKIYLLEKWGYSVPFEITAKYNANPNFASYYSEKGVSNEIIEKCISSIAPSDRIIFNSQLADEVLLKTNRAEWAKRVVVVVVTANRPAPIEGYFESAAESFYNLGIDLVIFDSSDNDKVKNITKTWADKYDNIKYHHWDGEFDGISIDNKVIDAYKTYCNDYEYVWVTREGVPINAKEVFESLKENFLRQDDFIVVNAIGRDEKKIGNKKYEDCKEFFKDQCHQMTILGTTIIKSSLIKEIIDNVPIDKIKNYGMWQPIAFFDYIANKNIKASSWVGRLWLPNSGAKPSSHWHKRILWQWGKRWYDMITNLPQVYDEYKNDALKFELIDCKPFSLDFIARARKQGGLTFSLINEYKKYIPFVTDTPISKFYIIALMPRILAPSIVKFWNKIGRYNKNVKRVSRKYDSIKHYETYENRFELYNNIKSNLLYGSQDKVENPYITVFIPTYRRLKLFKEALDSVLSQFPVPFNWNIIIVDNEPYDGTPNVTEKYIRSLNNDKITYYRNDENLKPGDNFNRGIYLAKAPWVMMLHDDDILLPNTLLKMSKNIEFLSSISNKPLGAVSSCCYQFKYDLELPNAHKAQLEGVKQSIIYSPTSYYYFKLTHANVLCTGHIGGSVPSCGAIFNRNAVMDVGGFNEDYGISADLVLYYNMEKKYSVYSSLVPDGFYRWGENQMSQFKNAYKTVKDNADFREYVFSKSIFNKIYGFLFGESLYYNFTKAVLSMRKRVTADHINFSDYADIYNQRPNALLYGIWKNCIFNGYNFYKACETKTISNKAKKYFKDKKS